MLQNGASAVIPVADIAEAQRYKSEGYWVGAERNARKCDFADGGNSPFDYPREKVEGERSRFHYNQWNTSHRKGTQLSSTFSWALLAICKC